MTTKELSPSCYFNDNGWCLAHPSGRRSNDCSVKCGQIDPNPKRFYATSGSINPMTYEEAVERAKAYLNLPREGQSQYFVVEMVSLVKRGEAPIIVEDLRK